MKKKPNSIPASATLLGKAEAKLKNSPPRKSSALSEAESNKLIHELEVHQVELEMQNDELQLANSVARDAVDLYDFAPSGYFTLSRDGEIIGLNLSGAQMLGKNRSGLIKNRFGLFVSDETKPVFNLFLYNIFCNAAKETCELILSGKNNQVQYVQLTGIVAENSDHCHVTATDITNRKLAELELEKQNDYLSKITKFSIDLSALPATENLEAFIARSIKEITGAVGVTYSRYDQENGMLVPMHIELDPGLLKKVVGLLSGQIQNVHSPVNEETYNTITANIIASYENLTDITFGAVPRTVGAIISSLIKAGRYIGIAHLIEGKLYGASMIALGKHQPDISDKILQNIAYLVAVSVRRKRAEEKLLHEQWRLKSIIEGTNVGTWEWNVQTGETIFSEQWAQIIGYSLDELKPLNISVWETFTHPEDLKKSTKLLQQHFSGELPYYDFECRMKHKDGHLVWVHDRGRVITRTEDGKPLMMFGTHNDITERKKTENALKESQENLSAIYNATEESVILISSDETIIAINNTAAKRIDRSVTKLIGQKVEDLFPPDVVAHRRPMINQVFQTGKSVVFEDQRNGHFLMNYIYPIFDEAGIVSRIAIFARDITEQKRAQNALRETEDRFRQVADNAPVLIWQSGTDALCNYFNQPWLNFTGRTLEQEYGNGWAEGVHPDDLQSCLDIHMNSFAEKKSFKMEYRLQRADGEYRWLLDHGIPRFAPDGEFLGYIGSCFDITESKQVEQALQQSESRFKKMFEHHSAIMLLIEPVSGLIIDANESATRFYGYSKAVLQTMYIEDINTFSKQQVKIEREKARINKQNYFVFEHKLATGEKRTVEVHSSPIDFQEKQILFSIIHDITDRKNAENEIQIKNEELQKAKEKAEVSEKRLLSIIDNTQAGYFFIDNDGIFQNVNQAWIDLYKYESFDEVIGKHFTTVQQIDDIENAKIFFEGIRKGNPDFLNGDFSRKCKDGTIGFHLFSARPVNFNNIITGIEGFIIDTTTQKMVEQALKRSKTLLTEAEILTGIGSWEWDVTNDTAYWSDGLFKIFKRNPKEGAPNWENHSAFYVKEDFELYKKVVAECLKNGTPYHFELRAICSDGVIRHCIARGNAVRNSEQTIDRLWGTLQDITERKKVEAELILKTEDLVKVNAEKDKFFSIIAHDLRGPIGGFIGLTEKMAEGMATMTLDDLQRIARVMKKSSANLYTLLGNLLEWSRMQRGLIPFNPLSITLRPKVNDILLSTFESANNKEITIKNTIPGDLEVYADENILSSIFRNLVANAVKFTNKSGTITIAAQPISNSLVEITVKDTGIGMSSDLIENLFNFDVNTSRKGTDGELSTGLGLMICKDFVEKHGGELRIESEEGKGSTFRFTIPSKTSL